MVEILNPKQKIFGANKKKTFKAYPTKPNNKYRENKGQRLSGKLPEFKQQKTYKKYDDTIIKSLCQQILQKKASKLEKKSAIKTVIEFIEKDTPRFIVKKWILRALEFSLKYGDSICRQKITTLFNENRETVLKCSSGKKLVLKIFAYADNKTVNSLFKEIKDKIFKIELSFKSINIANKIFDCLNNYQKRQLFAILLELDPENQSTHNNINSKDFFINIYPGSYPALFQYIENYIKISIKNNALNSHFLCFCLHLFCCKISIDEIKKLLLNIQIDHISALFYAKYGIYTVCRFLRSCSLSEYESVLNNLCSNDDHLFPVSSFSYFLLTSLYAEAHSLCFKNTIINLLIKNFEQRINLQPWCQLISHILEPRNKKLVPSNISEFIDHCNQFSGTPSSSLLYVNLIPEILPPLLNYLEFHMDIALKCQFMSNIILQIFKNHEVDASFRSFVDINAISLWITKLAPVVDENQVPFFSIKQVSWLSIKLIFEDATRDYIFINALVSHLDDAILSIWLQHKSTSFILSKVIEKAPSSLGEKLKEKIKFKSMDINL